MHPARLRSIVRRLVPLVAAAVTLTFLVSAPNAGASPLSGHITSKILSKAINKAPATTEKLTYNCNQHVAPGHFACQSIRRGNIGTFKPLDGSATDGYSPQQLQQAYNLPSMTEQTAATVAVVDAFDDPTAEADLAVYRATFGLPACSSANACFKKINQNGATTPLPAVDPGWAGEISLDLDMVSAICPSCHILLVEASSTSNDLYTAVHQAVLSGAKYVSMSFGGTDAASNAAQEGVFNAPGVGFFASSGDTAFKVLYPSSSPHVVAVGGTYLIQDGNTARTGGWDEGAWWNAEHSGDPSETGGGGSGCSVWSPKPSWQAAVVPASICGHRATADVSADADPASGVSVYQTTGGTGWSVVGGTSAAAPIIASTYALAGNPGTGSSAAIHLYATPSGLNDVTQLQNAYPCANILCEAAPGWDGPTGLGTPNGLGSFSADGLIRTTSAATSLSIPAVGPRKAIVGTRTSVQIKAHSTSATDTLTYRSSGLPSGMALNGSTGLISGTARKAGTYHPIIRVTGTSGAGAATTFTFTVAPACVAGTVTVLTGTHALTGQGRSRSQTLAKAVRVRASCKAVLTLTVNVSGRETAHTAKDTLVMTVNGHVVKRLSNLNRGNHAIRVSLSAYAGKTITIKFVSKQNATKTTTFKIGSTKIKYTR